MRPSKIRQGIVVNTKNHVNYLCRVLLREIRLIRVKRVPGSRTPPHREYGCTHPKYHRLTFLLLEVSEVSPLLPSSSSDIALSLPPPSSPASTAPVSVSQPLPASSSLRALYAAKRIICVNFKQSM